MWFNNVRRRLDGVKPTYSCLAAKRDTTNSVGTRQEGVLGNTPRVNIVTSDRRAPSTGTPACKRHLMVEQKLAGVRKVKLLAGILQAIKVPLYYFSFWYFLCWACFQIISCAVFFFWGGFHSGKRAGAPVRTLMIAAAVTTDSDLECIHLKWILLISPAFNLHL